MIPIYLLWNKVGHFTTDHAWLPHIGTGTQYPLWVPNLFGSPFYIFLLRQFFLGIPRDYFEAARMDGDSYFSMFRRIALPLAKPALIVTFIFEVQAKWFDLMNPLIYLRNEALFTAPLGMKFLLDRFNAQGGGEGAQHVRPRLLRLRLERVGERAVREHARGAREGEPARRPADLDRIAVAPDVRRHPDVVSGVHQCLLPCPARADINRSGQDDPARRAIHPRAHCRTATRHRATTRPRRPRARGSGGCPRDGAARAPRRYSRGRAR